METSELTKKQKLAVIDEILENYESSESYQWYICMDIKYTVRDKGYYKDYYVSDRNASEFIPELLMVKPEGEDMIGEWFGSDDDPENRPRRLAALRKMRALVMKSEK
jgi:hypothetical protein